MFNIGQTVMVIGGFFMRNATGRVAKIHHSGRFVYVDFGVKHRRLDMDYFHVDNLRLFEQSINTTLSK